MSVQFSALKRPAATAAGLPGRDDRAPLPLTWTSAISPLPGLLQAHGSASLPDLLERAGLPEIAIEHDRDLIPVAAACALLEHASRRTGIAEIGLALGEDARPPAFGAWGAHVAGADHLLEAIARMDRHAAPNLLGVASRLQVIGPSAIWSCAPSPAAGVGRHHSAMLALASMRAVVRLAAGPDWRADEVRIPAAACDLERLRQSWDERVLPGMAYALLFPRGLLCRPMPLAARRACFPDAASLAREERALPTDLVDSVRVVLRTFLRAGYPHLPDFARACGLSIRKLQRSLADSGTTYSRLIEQIRREDAMAMLAEGRITVTEVGLELGYSETASFTRAFRRWQGLPPRDYRQMAAEPGDAASGR